MEKKTNHYSSLEDVWDVWECGQNINHWNRIKMYDNKGCNGAAALGCLPLT